MRLQVSKQFVDHDKNPLGSTFPYTNQQPTVFISSNPITCVRLESTTRVKLGKMKIGEGGGGGIHVGRVRDDTFFCDLRSLTIILPNCELRSLTIIF